MKGGAEIGLFEVALDEEGAVQVAVVKYGFLQNALAEVSLYDPTRRETEPRQIQSLEGNILHLAFLETGVEGITVAGAEVGARHLAGVEKTIEVSLHDFR